VEIVRRTISAKKKNTKKNYQYHLYNWANCKVNGIKKLIFGNTFNNNLLKYINECDIERIPEEFKSKWSDVKCYTFLDDLLEFIRFCVNKDDAVYEFSFDFENKFITCYKLKCETTYQSLLPKWFTDNEF